MKTKLTFEQLAVRLAKRTKEYVSVDGKRPTDETMDCDIEMWDFADAVLKAQRELKPKQRKA